MIEADHHKPAAAPPPKPKNPRELASDGPMPPCAICGPATGKPHDNVVLLDRYLICLECNVGVFAVLRREVLQLRGILAADMMASRRATVERMLPELSVLRIGPADGPGGIS